MLVETLILCFFAALGYEKRKKYFLSKYELFLFFAEKIGIFHFLALPEKP